MYQKITQGKLLSKTKSSVLDTKVFNSFPSIKTTFIEQLKISRCARGPSCPGLHRKNPTVPMAGEP